MNHNLKYKSLLIFFNDLSLCFVLFSTIYCILNYKIEIEMDDCFKEIKINEESKFSVTSCDYERNRITTFNEFTGNYGDIFTFYLNDDGQPAREGGNCFIQGYIQINEYKVSTSQTALWECTNCKYNQYQILIN